MSVEAVYGIIISVGMLIWTVVVAVKSYRAEFGDESIRISLPTKEFREAMAELDEIDRMTGLLPPKDATDEARDRMAINDAPVQRLAQAIRADNLAQEQATWALWRKSLELPPVTARSERR